LTATIRADVRKGASLCQGSASAKSSLAAIALGELRLR
jgi:hypothetical protein